MSGRIFSLNTGKAHTILQNGRERLTAIGKQPVLLPLQMGELGLDGDVQVDKPDHGGVMKAVCCYPREHYEYWERRLGRRLPAAAFGENFTTDGQMEETVWIGDVFASAKKRWWRWCSRAGRVRRWRLISKRSS